MGNQTSPEQVTYWDEIGVWVYLSCCSLTLVQSKRKAPKTLLGRLNKNWGKLFV